MDRLSEQFFTRPGFTHEQDGGCSSRRLVSQFDSVVECRRIADKMIEGKKGWFNVVNEESGKILNEKKMRKEKAVEHFKSVTGLEEPVFGNPETEKTDADLDPPEDLGE